LCATFSSAASAAVAAFEVACYSALPALVAYPSDLVGFPALASGLVAWAIAGSAVEVQNHQSSLAASSAMSGASSPATSCLASSTQGNQKLQLWPLQQRAMD